jgi:hypothetical protein
MVDRLDDERVELLIRLGEYNAPRRCTMCDSDAEYYVFDEARTVSEYACGTHLDRVVDREQG